MAVLCKLPSGTELPLKPRETFRHERSGQVEFLLVPYRRRWLLFDSGGRTRVDSRRVAGAVVTLKDGTLIRSSLERFRFQLGGHHPLRISASAGDLCSFCRAEMTPEESALLCPKCERLLHEECHRQARRCGRCLQPLGEVAP